jgi:H2-forming N5,N10-methylenetetrahydromethanopterin dehydrogenase-like enzyme
MVITGGIPGRMPAAVPANGNCLFNALSVAIAGNISLATELRVRTCIEMVENRRGATSYIVITYLVDNLQAKRMNFVMNLL